MTLTELRNQIESLNQALARDCQDPPAELSFQSGESGSDTLFLYGILGGKDVGKTSLINQLAGESISLDTNLLDEGTRTGVAYCHEKDRESLARRLNMDRDMVMEYVTHNRDELKNVVLIDFPDFDSRFAAHLDYVHQLAPHLQGILWLTTPRKYADHELFDQLERVAQSHENYYIVLNKVDQIEKQASSEEIQQEVLGLLNRACQRRGIPSIPPQRFFMVSAQQPNRFEFGDLHARLIRPHSPEEIARAKAWNLQSEFEKNIHRLREHYGVQDRLREVEAALDQVQTGLETAFPEAYFQRVQQRVLAMDSIQRRIGTGVFQQRIEHWPILRSLFYPLSGLVSFIGGRMAFRPNPEEWAQAPRDLLRYDGQTVWSRLESIRADLETEYPNLAEVLQWQDDPREEIDQQFNRCLFLYEERVVERIAKNYSPPGAMKRSLAYVPLVWFPFLQPVLLNWAQPGEEASLLGGIGEFFTLLISLLGAGALLESLVFLIVFYLVWLLFFYAQGTRDILQIGKEEFYSAWQEEFLPWLHSQFNEPLERYREKWLGHERELQNIEKQIESLVESYRNPA